MQCLNSPFTKRVFIDRANEEAMKEDLALESALHLIEPIPSTYAEPSTQGLLPDTVTYSPMHSIYSTVQKPGCTKYLQVHWEHQQ